MSNITVEQLAVTALREWLLLQLPAKVAAVNAQRFAVLKAPIAGPYVIPPNAKLHHSSTRIEGPWTDIALTSGTRSATQVAADVELVVPGIASADAFGRLALTAAAAPIVGTDSLVALGPDTTGANAALGFDAGGERAQTSALVCPGYKGVADGTPMHPDMGPGFWLILGDALSVPVRPDVRRDEYTVAISLALSVPVPSGSMHRTREHLRAAMRCVREVLFNDPTSQGRTLGGVLGIQLVTETQALVKSRPVQFKEMPNAMFSRAQFQLNVRVYETQTP